MYAGKKLAIKSAIAVQSEGISGRSADRTAVLGPIRNSRNPLLAVAVTVTEDC